MVATVKLVVRYRQLCRAQQAEVFLLPRVPAATVVKMLLEPVTVELVAPVVPLLLRSRVLALVAVSPLMRVLRGPREPIMVVALLEPLARVVT
jgi:hypothetical protein